MKSDSPCQTAAGKDSAEEPQTLLNLLETSAPLLSFCLPLRSLLLAACSLLTQMLSEKTKSECFENSATNNLSVYVKTLNTHTYTN